MRVVLLGVLWLIAVGAAVAAIGNLWRAVRTGDWALIPAVLLFGLLSAGAVGQAVRFFRRTRKS